MVAGKPWHLYFFSTDEQLSAYFYAHGGEFPSATNEETPSYVKTVSGSQGDVINTPFGTSATASDIVNGDKVFLGWSANPYAKEATYKDASSVPVGQLGQAPFNTAFYAIWGEPVATCTVTFDAGEGYFGNVSQKQVTKTFDKEAAIVVPDNLVAPEGETFIGYFDSTTGEAMPTTCEASATYVARYQEEPTPSYEGGGDAGLLPATGDTTSFISFLTAGVIALGACLALKKD